MPVRLALVFRPYSFLEIGDEVADREGRAWLFGGPWDWSPFGSSPGLAPAWPLTLITRGGGADPDASAAIGQATVSGATMTRSAAGGRIPGLTYRQALKQCMIGQVAVSAVKARSWPRDSRFGISPRTARRHRGEEPAWCRRNAGDLPAEDTPGIGCGHVGSGFEHVDEEAARRLTDLADRVRATLTGAGIHVSASASPDPGGGAVIDVDTGAVEAGGVYIAWQLPRAQHDELLSCLHAGQHSHPGARYLFEVRRSMREAIMAILNAAGLTAARSEDHNDMAPLEVLVTG